MCEARVSADPRPGPVQRPGAALPPGRGGAVPQPQGASARVPAGASRSGGPSIPHWPAAERPRERLVRLGPEALSDSELLAIVVRTGHARGTALDLGRALLALGGAWGLAGLARLHVDDLAALPGMGPAKGAVVLAAVEMGRRAARAPAPQPVRLRGPEDVGADLVLQMGALDREQFRVLLLDTKHGIIGSELVAVGGLDHVPADPREVFKPAVRRSAAAVLVAHNHPSGDAEPSARDLDLTARLVAAGRVLGIPVLDHIVVGARAYVSLASRGVVPQV